jgi:hypothetical protein
MEEGGVLAVIGPGFGWGGGGSAHPSRGWLLAFVPNRLFSPTPVLSSGVACTCVALARSEYNAAGANWDLCLNKPYNDGG